MVNWKFWKRYTLTVTSKRGNVKISYTVTAPTIQEAKNLIQEMRGTFS